MGFEVSIRRKMVSDLAADSLEFALFEEFQDYQSNALSQTAKIERVYKDLTLCQKDRNQLALKLDRADMEHGRVMSLNTQLTDDMETLAIALKQEAKINKTLGIKL